MAASRNTTTRTLDAARKAGVLRVRDLEAQGISRMHVQRMYQRGELERVGRGLYMHPEFQVTEHHALAEACARVPRGVVCLLSALRFHGLTTAAPRGTWLAIQRGARAPKPGPSRLNVVRMSATTIRAGVETHRIEGIDVRIFSPARTVADCFKFRGRVGLDLALEALRDFLRRRPHRNMDELWRHARQCRVANVVRPYLECLA